ncbi:MAG: MarR family winged helix-turn-helix transcriptional regulator, partial [Actinomycetota bacterium]|nr:MarR family winged helix-turn-helix transcriptional regulator [Actinomycetota bacterium]
MRDDVPWLDEQEAVAWRGWIDSAAVIMRLIERDLKADSGLNFDDYEVLVYLSDAPGHRLGFAELSSALVHSPSRLSQRLDRMNTCGWVVREGCDRDRRSVVVALTDEGLRVLDAASPA